MSEANKINNQAFWFARNNGRSPQTYTLDDSAQDAALVSALKASGDLPAEAETSVGVVFSGMEVLAPKT